MAKRSPILGYNHNVRYRGLIFHVQTEDSGVLSPHLFTHLFHTGVIVSTRKLVYDAGSDEGAIKSLMQAQHKAVMKDLKRGTFDDKIDQYLGGTAGLLPRGTASADESQPAEPLRDSQPVLARPSDPGIPQPGAETDRPSEPVIVLEPAMPDDDAPDVNATIRTTMIDPNSAPIEMGQTLRGMTPAGVASAPESAPAIAAFTDDDLALGHFKPSPTKQPEPAPLAWLDDPVDASTQQRGSPPPRTRTAERGSSASTIRTTMPPPPPPGDLDGPTALDDAGAVAAALSMQANATIRMPMPRDMELDQTPASLAEIIQLELEPEETATRTRTARDTDIVVPETSDGVPGYTTAPAETPRPRANESVPPLPPPPSSSSPRLGASALPPARPISRPPARPAITPPQVVSRPITRDQDDRARNHGDSDAIEVYAPAPPSTEAPPGMATERPGQYAQHKRVSQKMPAIDMPRERSGAVPIPPGLGRPGNRLPTGQNPALSRATPPPLPRDVRPAPSAPVPQAVRGEPSSGQGVVKSRTTTPTRTSPAGRSGSSSVPNSGVVMTRPAVIVGAPAKPAQPSRVRKAREDEGRGFGQGLISEKSLDEVILAYLSEDADDK